MGELVVLNSVEIKNLAEIPGGAFDEELGLNIVGNLDIVAMVYNEVGYDGFVYEPGSIPNSNMAMLEHHWHENQVGVLRIENGAFEGDEVAFGYGAFNDTNQGRDGLVKARNNHRLGIQQTSTGLFIEQYKEGDEMGDDLRARGARRSIQMTDTFETSLVLRGNIPGTRTVSVNSSLPIEVQLSQIKDGMSELVARLTRDNRRELMEQLAHELQTHSASIASALNEAGRGNDADQVTAAAQSVAMPQELIAALANQAGVGATVRIQLEGLAYA